MTEQIGTSNLLRTWANDGTVVIPADAKIDEGWLRGEQPPHEWMNYIHNVLGQKINHMLSRGAPDWNAETEFPAGAVVRHSGAIWIATATNANSEPASANTNWSLALGGRENLSGLADADTARGNLGLGAAAIQDVTTGPLDNTIGRVPRFLSSGGIFGLGTRVPSFPPSNDANEINEVGVYRTDADTLNVPNNFVIIEHIARTSGSYFQKAYRATSSSNAGETWIRNRNSNDGWSDWYLDYNARNVLGTVSQSGGVPTGAVFERDSNDDGQWTRLADGLQIMTRVADVDLTDSASQLFDFPIQADGTSAALGWGGAPGSTLSGDGRAASRSYVSTNISAQAWIVRCDGDGESTRVANLTAISYWY